MRPFLPFAVAAVALGLLSGCGRHYYGYHGHGHYERVVIVTKRPPRGQRVYVDHRVYYTTNNYNNAAPPPVATPPRPVANDAPPFDSNAARTQFNDIDVTSCRDAGTASGFGHANVTFSPDGRVTKVLVDEPRGLSTEAVSCVGSRLGTVSVSPFRGSAVTMGTTYRL